MSVGHQELLTLLIQFIVMLSTLLLLKSQVESEPTLCIIKHWCFHYNVLNNALFVGEILCPIKNGNFLHIIKYKRLLSTVLSTKDYFTHCPALKLQFQNYLRGTNLTVMGKCFSLSLCRFLCLWASKHPFLSQRQSSPNICRNIWNAIVMRGIVQVCMLL